MAPLFQPGNVKPFSGDCTSVSGFYTLCCKAIGVDMNMSLLLCPPLEDRTKAFWTYMVFACGIYEYWSPLGDHRLTQWDNWFFHAHQVASFEGRAFDPTLKYPTTYISPIPPDLPKPQKAVSWQEGFAANVDRNFEYQSNLVYELSPGTTSIGWYKTWALSNPEEYTIREVIWPKWKKKWY